ncbi:MAG: porin [Brachymonas sp.]|nr:porin [Brachymonas sp.]
MPTTTGGEAKEWAFAVSYDLGIAKPYFIYQNGQAKAIAANATVPGTNKTTSYLLGATFPMGALTPYVEVGNSKNRENVANTASRAKASGYQIGALYSLSKRTTAYAALGNSKTTDTSVGNVGGFRKTNDFNLGIRHDF